MDRQRMGRVGEQTQSEILPAHRSRQAQIANGSGEMESHGGFDRRNPGYDGGGSMTMWSRLRSWLRVLLQRSRVEKEMDAELRFHIEAFAEDLVRSGVPRKEALRRERIEFGGIERAKEECREARGISFVDGLLKEFRFGRLMYLQSLVFNGTTCIS